LYFCIETKPEKKLSKKEQKAKEDAELEALLSGIPVSTETNKEE